MNSTGGQTMSPRAPSRQRREIAAGGRDAIQRQVIFWLGALVVVVLALWLLSEILLPFVAGLAIAYLLTPLTDRLERVGVNRLAAALLIITLVVLASGLSDFAGRADSRRPIVVLHRERSRQRDQIADTAKRSKPALGSETIGRQLQRGQIDWRSGDARRRLADLISALVVVGWPCAGVAVLADRRHAGGRVLSHLRLASHDPHRRWLDSACAARTLCARLARRDRCSDCRALCAGQTAVCLILGSFYAISADTDRPQFRTADRPDFRPHHFHSLCRIDDRACACPSA